MSARLLCVFGTASDVGKSWVAAGLCRLFANQGVRVAPFKAQNISNNAGVTPDGLEMGRAQIVQAQACRLVPHVDMNPLLVKPQGEGGAQVVTLGRVQDSAQRWFGSTEAAAARRALVTGALDRLRAAHDLVVAEGAGSCAEVNLRGQDLVNLPIAHHGAGAVLLVADIHRGGVFAQCVGTLACMPPADRARVKGFVINRFQGDPAFFAEGRDWLEAETGLPVLGVVPWAEDIQIELEDGLAPDTPVDGPLPTDRTRFQVAVLKLPHVSNVTDTDALERHGAQVHWLSRPRDLSAYDLVVLPGSKNTRQDLAWLRKQGWDRLLQARAAAGRAVLGICGGYQMLGERIADPHGIEGEPGQTPGLGLLPVDTVMAQTKTTRLTRGRLGALPVEGYEIHVGETDGAGEPLLWLEDEDGTLRPDGAQQGLVQGTYLHGLFDAPGVVAALLGPLRPDLTWPDLPTHASWRDDQLDRLAAHLEQHLDLVRLREVLGEHPG